jgi:hypothetical protein
MSALPPKADMCGATRDVRFGPIADIAPSIRSLHRRANRLGSFEGDHQARSVEVPNTQWTKVPYTDRVDGVMFCAKQLSCIINHACAKEEVYMGILDELLGGGQRQKEYRDFVNRYEQGHPSEGYSDQEVLKRYGDVSHAVPPNQYTQAAIEALGKLSPEDRAAFLNCRSEPPRSA